MKKTLIGILLVGAQMLLGAAMAAGSIGIADIKDGAEFSADTVDMGFGPPIMLPAGKKWQVIKRTEFEAFAKNWSMVRFTLLNASPTDTLQMVTISTNLTRVQVSAPGPDKCIKIPGALTQNYRNLGTNVFGCSVILSYPDLKATLPELIPTTVEKYSFGLLSGLLKPLAANPALFDRIGSNPLFVNEQMYRFGKQHNFYTMVLRNSTAYSPKADPVLDAKLDTWVRDYFNAAHSYLNEDPVLKVATLPVPDLGSFVPTVEVPKPPSSDTVTLRAQNGTALWMDEKFVVIPKNNRILFATKDRRWVRWVTGGWLASLIYIPGTVFGYGKEGIYDVVIVNDAVYENFPTQMAD